MILTIAPDTVIGPDDEVLIPVGHSRRTGKWSWPSSSVGPPAIWTSAKDPLSDVAGYAISSDISEREFQLQ